MDYIILSVGTGVGRKRVETRLNTKKVAFTESWTGGAHEFDRARTCSILKPTSNGR